jgi:hypothetical protein
MTTRRERERERHKMYFLGSHEMSLHVFEMNRKEPTEWWLNINIAKNIPPLRHNDVYR